MGVLVWVLVVLAGSSLVWVVISQAGEGVAPQPGASVAAGDPVADAGRTTPPSGTRPPKGSATGRATPRPGAPTSSPAGDSSPSVSPSAAPTAGSETEPGEQPPQEPTSPSSATSPSRRTWSGSGGSVIAECTGSRIGLVAAQPDGGFAVDVGSRGPEQVEVSFHGRGEEERESEIHALCVGGTPRFSADSNRED